MLLLLLLLLKTINTKQNLHSIPDPVRVTHKRRVRRMVNPLLMIIPLLDILLRNNSVIWDLKFLCP
jgi:hypothetical protein